MIRNHWHEITHIFPIWRISFAVVVIYACIKMLDIVAVTVSTWLLTKGF